MPDSVSSPHLPPETTPHEGPDNGSTTTFVASQDHKEDSVVLEDIVTYRDRSSDSDNGTHRLGSDDGSLFTASSQSHGWDSVTIDSELGLLDEDRTPHGDPELAV